MGRKGFEIDRIIKNKLNEGSINGKELENYVKKELGLDAPKRKITFEQALIKVLEEEAGNIKISYDPSLDNRKLKQSLKVEYLRFDLDNKKYSKLQIHRLFKGLESDDINKHDESMDELLGIFEKKFDEYRNWENTILNQMKNCVECLPYDEVTRELERIHKEKLQFDDPSIDETIKEYLDIYIRRLLRGDPGDRFDKLESFIAREREFMKEENYTHLSFLKSRSCLGYIHLLPPGFPTKAPRYEAIGSKDCMTPGDYLLHCDVRTLPGGSINIEDIFYDLLFYLESHDTNILRNTIINCLSYQKTDAERLENLKRFGRILKELGYIELSFNERIGRDKHGRRVRGILDRNPEETAFLKLLEDLK